MVEITAGREREPKFKGILVDLDNTLYDFGVAKEVACKKVIAVLGKGNPDELINSFLFSPHGVESPLALKEYLINNDLYNPVTFDDLFRIYSLAKIEAIIAYPGVFNTLSRIHAMGLKIGAITNAQKKDAMTRLEHIHVNEFMDCVVTPDLAGCKKPDPAMFHYAASLLHIQPRNMCVIGDNLLNDINPAKQMGMCTIHAEYGNKLPPEYSQGITPDFVISSFSDILAILTL